MEDDLEPHVSTSRLEQAIHIHAAAENNAIPGHNYHALSALLRRPSSPPPYRWSEHANSQSSGSDCIANTEDVFAVLYDLDVAGDEDHAPTSFASMHGDSSFTARALPVNGLLFLRGAPSPAWLRALCRKVDLDPEFLQQHLDFGFDVHDGRNHFDKSLLPSARRNALRLPISTILTRGDLTWRKGGENLSARRAKVADEMDTYRAAVLGSATTGDSMVRDYTVISDRDAVLEQCVTITVCESDESRLIVIWMDHGKDLGNIAEGSSLPTPWVHNAEEKSNKVAAMPIIQHYEFLPLEVPNDTESSEDEEVDWSASWRARQNACRLPFDHGRFLRSSGVSINPLDAILGVLSLSTHSQNQMLNVISAQIGLEIAAGMRNGSALDNLRYLRCLISNKEEVLQSLTLLISDKDGLYLADHDMLAASRQRFNSVVSDVKYLHDRAAKLVDACEHGIGDLVNQSVFEVSLKGLNNAKQIERLTLTATIFIPLSFTCALFGMNFKEMGTGALSIWVFPVALVMVLGCCLMLYFSDIHTWLEKLVGLKKGGSDPVPPKRR